MNTPLKTKIKICCISSVEEALMAINHGASAIGLVSEMPSGPGVISEELISTIAGIMPAEIATFLLTSKQDAASIIAQHRRTNTTTLQICDRLEIEYYKELRKALTGIELVQVIHITGPKAVDEAMSTEPYVDAFLLDSGNPSLAVKELGGTGRIHDWRLSRVIRESVNVPVFLAGGLTPENVADAIRQVDPFGVDVCSGVRTDGRLDAIKSLRFINQVINA